MATVGQPPKKLECNEYGKPIGEASVRYSSFLGSLSREFVPYTLECWDNLAEEVKDTMWDCLKNRLPIIFYLRKQSPIKLPCGSSSSFFFPYALSISKEAKSSAALKDIAVFGVPLFGHQERPSQVLPLFWSSPVFADVFLVCIYGDKRNIGVLAIKILDTFKSGNGGILGNTKCKPFLKCCWRSNFI